MKIALPDNQELLYLALWRSDKTSFRLICEATTLVLNTISEEGADKCNYYQPVKIWRVDTFLKNQALAINQIMSESFQPEGMPSFDNLNQNQIKSKLKGIAGSDKCLREQLFKEAGLDEQVPLRATVQVWDDFILRYEWKPSSQAGRPTYNRMNAPNLADIVWDFRSFCWDDPEAQEKLAGLKSEHPKFLKPIQIKGASQHTLFVAVLEEESIAVGLSNYLEDVHSTKDSEKLAQASVPAIINNRPSQIENRDTIIKIIKRQVEKNTNGLQSITKKFNYVEKPLKDYLEIKAGRNSGTRHHPNARVDLHSYSKWGVDKREEARNKLILDIANKLNWTEIRTKNEALKHFVTAILKNDGDYKMARKNSRDLIKKILQPKNSRRVSEFFQRVENAIGEANLLKDFY
jgi:uncharacterized protein (DUF2225 family)